MEWGRCQTLASQVSNTDDTGGHEILVPSGCHSRQHEQDACLSFIMTALSNFYDSVWQTTTKRKSNIYDRRWTGLTAGCLPQNSKVKNVLAFVKCLEIFFTWRWCRCLLVSNGLVGKRHEDWGACNLHLANGKFTRDVAYFLMYTRFSEKTNATI